MHILLTRPLEDSKEFIVKLKSLGHKVSHLPVIEVNKLKLEKINFNEYSGIIFTSVNAVRFLDTKDINKSIYCFCVGSVTERSVLKKGFQNVFAADGNVDNLKEIILRNFNQNTGKLLYVSGEMISSNLHKKLTNQDYKIDRIINYKVDHIKKFDEKFIDNLKKEIPEIIYVYSQNSAKSLLNIIKKYQLVDYWMNTNLMCIGEKTSAVLNEIKWKKIFLFNPGEEEYLLYKI